MAARGQRKNLDKEEMYAKIMPSFVIPEYDTEPQQRTQLPPQPKQEFLLRNFTENLIISSVDHIIKMLDGCSCESCRKRAMALALNALPSCYQVLERDEVEALLKELQDELGLKVRAVLIQAVQQVKADPWH